MNAANTQRLLSIGEFSAATQLSPKALRLYDEQRILRPAVVDAANGYRYYRDDQIALGRLIRTLRDMELPLAAVADVIAADVGRAEMLLRQSAQEGERRLARQKRAYQAALTLIQRGRPVDSPRIVDRARPALTVAVRPFLAERRALVDRFRAELALGYASLAQAGVVPAGEPMCVLIDPVADEEGRAEVAIPVAVSESLPRGLTLRQLPARACAALATEFAEPGALELTAALDALFDWFDRRACHAAEPPAVSFASGDDILRAELVWAHEPVSATEPSR